MNMLYHAHSGLRYLVLLAAVVAIVGIAYTLATRRGVRAAHVLPSIFTGLLDLQILLGIGLVLGGVFPDIVIGHLIMMVLAAVAAHGSSIIANRADSERRALTIRLVGTVAALVLIAVGIMALGRSVLGTAPMVG
jgi:hypothetical protein